MRLLLSHSHLIRSLQYIEHAISSLSTNLESGGIGIWMRGLLQRLLLQERSGLLSEIRDGMSSDSEEKDVEEWGEWEGDGGGETREGRER